MNEREQNSLEIKEWLAGGFSFKDDKFYRDYILYLIIDHRFNRNGPEILFTDYSEFREELIKRISQDECIQLRSLEDSCSRFIDTGDLEIYENEIWPDAVSEGFMPDSYIDDVLGSIVAAKSLGELKYVVMSGSLGRVDKANNGYVSFLFIVNILYESYNLVIDVSKVYRLKQWFKLMKEEWEKISLPNVEFHVADPTIQRAGLIVRKVEHNNHSIDIEKYSRVKEYFSGGCTFREDRGYMDWVMYQIAKAIAFEERKILTFEEYNIFCCGKTFIVSKKMYRVLEHEDLVLREFIESGDVEKLLYEANPIKLSRHSKLANKVKEVSISQFIDCIVDILFGSTDLLDISRICNDLLDTDYGYILFVVLVEKLYRDYNLVYDTKTFIDFMALDPMYNVLQKCDKDIETQKAALCLQDKLSIVNPYDQVVYRVKEYLDAGTQLKSLDDAWSSLNSIYNRIISGDYDICNYIDDMLDLFYVKTCNTDKSLFSIYMFICSSDPTFDSFNNNSKFDKVENKNLVVALHWYLQCVFKTIGERYGYSIVNAKRSRNGVALITKSVNLDILNKLFRGRVDDTELEVDYGYFKLYNTKYGELTITGAMYKDDKEMISKIKGVYDLDTQRQVKLFESLNKSKVGTSDYRSCVSKLISTAINLYALGKCFKIIDRTEEIKLDKNTKRYIDKLGSSGIYSNLLLLDGLKDDEKLETVNSILEMNRCFERLEAGIKDSESIGLCKKVYKKLLECYRDYRPVITGSLMFTLGLLSGTSTIAIIGLLIAGIMLIYSVNKVDAFYVNMRVKDLSRSKSDIQKRR